MAYRPTGGQKAAWWHRWSGVAIVAYLYFHLIVLGTILFPHGQRTFNHVLAMLQSPPTLVADFVLFALILYHALNGLRVILIEGGRLILHSRLALWAAMVVGALLIFFAGIVLIPAVLA